MGTAGLGVILLTSASSTTLEIYRSNYEGMSTIVHLSSPPLFSRTAGISFPATFGPTSVQFKNVWSNERLLLLRVNCLPEPTGDVESESGPSSLPSSSPVSSTGISSYSWCAGLGGIGFLETGYLTYLKLTNSDAFCPVGGGSCGDVLNSDYASVFGVPLPLIGMFAYGLVGILGLQLAGGNTSLKMDPDNGRLILLGSTTSMAAASAYFLYTLSTKFEGASCLYCLVSALLSFSLFTITLKNFGLQELRKVAALPLCASALVIAILSTSYNNALYIPPSSAEIDLRPFTTEILTQSSPSAVALAKHLHSIGAKMYGAFWCSHCIEQKQMFGYEASKILDYVECFPNGYRKGVTIAKECADAKIEGFPTWVINGEVLSGEQELAELARVSGFKSDYSNFTSE